MKSDVYDFKKDVYLLSCLTIHFLEKLFLEHSRALE